MWAGVRERFTKFHRTLQLTAEEVEDGVAKQLGLRQSLQRAYWGPTTPNPPGFIVGSWGKMTAIRPPNDIDVFMELPLAVYDRFNGYAGNGQSALLQEVKACLENTYRQTQMRGDGQVVVIAFNSVTIEVVPVFRYDDDGNWLMPDTNNGGSWRVVNPGLEQGMLNYADMQSSNNARRLIHIIKAWKSHCSVPLKSYHIEILVCEFLEKYAYKNQDFWYFDWFVRDFFEFLVQRKNYLVFARSSGRLVNIGDTWLTKAQTAYNRAKVACDYEYADFVLSAGDEWRKIFGERIS